jgi:hypothetical protein
LRPHHQQQQCPGGTQCAPCRHGTDSCPCNHHKRQRCISSVIANAKAKACARSHYLPLVLDVPMACARSPYHHTRQPTGTPIHPLPIQ